MRTRVGIEQPVAGPDYTRRVRICRETGPAVRERVTVQVLTRGDIERLTGVDGQHGLN